MTKLAKVKEISVILGVILTLLLIIGFWSDLSTSVVRAEDTAFENKEKIEGIQDTIESININLEKINTKLEANCETMTDIKTSISRLERKVYMLE